jgi:hypothetical protein
MGNLKNSMGSRQIVLVSTAGISVLNAGIFWREAKTKRLFSQCNSPYDAFSRQPWPLKKHTLKLKKLFKILF